MGNLSGFNAAEVAPETGRRTVIPTGDYRAMIVDSDVKPTKTGGEMIVLTVQVLDGQYAGEQITDRLNIVNANPKAVAIAQGRLSAICHAVGVLTPNDTVELHNKPFSIRVEVKPDSFVGDNGETVNIERSEIKAYKAEGAGNVQQPTAPAAAATPASPSNSTPPWAQKQVA